MFCPKPVNTSGINGFHEVLINFVLWIFISWFAGITKRSGNYIFFRFVSKKVESVLCGMSVLGAVAHNTHFLGHVSVHGMTLVGRATLIISKTTTINYNWTNRDLLIAYTTVSRRYNQERVDVVVFEVSIPFFSTSRLYFVIAPQAFEGFSSYVNASVTIIIIRGG